MHVLKHVRLTHLYIPNQFDYPIHLIPGANLCFSNLKFLSCNTSINDNVLSGLTEMCKSIKEIELVVKEDNNNYGIIKLIEATKKLELKIYGGTNMTWNYLENLSLPFLQILKAQRIPVEVLTNIIKNTNNNLIKIKIEEVSHCDLFDWGYLFEVLTKSSPISLFKIKLQFDEAPTLESLKIFFDNWKDRHSLSLQTLQVNSDGVNLLNWDYRYLDLVDECLCITCIIRIFIFMF
uniref:F-box associated domain-containing protein n=1 Tax=Rhizophagus irregularis (strain DAOM 181602 / DAOM 197198 / MUCL 43194) TaxID=747089 RepID=U9UZ55_RHIID